MHVEAEISIARPRVQVFEYLARSEHLPDYATDFAWVKQTSHGEPRLGTEYRYRLKRGTEGTFARTEFEPHLRLAWHGPSAKAGPGSMEPAGRWELSDAPEGTKVKLVMAPQPHGLLKLLAPMISRGIRKDLPVALQRLKQTLEQPAVGSPA
jgi:uncharacterized protein YndB with AHSA1/START domain